MELEELGAVFEIAVHPTPGVYILAPGARF